MKRRSTLKIISAMPFTGFFYIKKTIACSMGMSLDFISGLPDGYQLPENNNDYILNIVKKYLGRTDWVYANKQNLIKTPEYAGNAAVVPVAIELHESSDKVIFEKMIILAEKHVEVLINEHQNIEIPNRNQQVPINLKLNTVSATSLIKVASYNFSNHPVSNVSMRLNLSDTTKALFMAILLPADKSKPVQIIRQKNAIKVGHACDRVVYVIGEMPKGSEHGFYYF